MNDEKKQDPIYRVSKPAKRGVLYRLLNVLLVLLVLAGIAELVRSGIVPRLKAAEELRKETTYSATPTVSVMQPKRGSPSQDLTLPATIQAFADAPIYARTNGYLKRWFVDIGAHVKAGELLAEIDTPEIQQQVQQARADLATAEANSSLAETTSVRYQDLLKSDSVSKQEAENTAGELRAKKSVVQSLQFNVKRLEELQSFQKLYAPFDGVVTARNTEIGALIGGGAKELFHIAAMDKVRIYVNVPQVYSREAKAGMTADLTLTEYPGRHFTAKLARTSGSIDEAGRTLLVEFDANNASGELLPGAYGEIHLKLHSGASPFLLPVGAMIFRSEGVRIATVKDGHAVLVPVTLGRDFGNEIEIIDGLTGDEQVITNPTDSLISGEAVRIVEAAANTKKEKP